MVHGPLMIDLESKTLSSKECALLKHSEVGGVILFKRNFSDIDQLKALVQEIRQEARNPLLIAVDHEGGQIWRFEAGFTRLPPAQTYGLQYEQDPEKARAQARQAAATMASELLECGIDISLAPVLDVEHGISKVIGDRSFHPDPNIVSDLAGAFIQGMNSVGMAATGKHFPGHGGCKQDSHFATAIDTRTLAEISATDIIPFAKLGNMLGAVMPSHVIYPEVDSVPAGYSRIWLQDILRKALQFQGAIISDCLSMKGAAIGGDFVVRTHMALDAGCDMVILCEPDRDLIQWVLNELDRTTSKESHQRLLKMAGSFRKETSNTML